MNTLIEKLNSLKIIQKYDWIESIPSDIYNEYFDWKYTIVAEWIDIEEHRWYDISTTVININWELIWVKHISKLNSESSSFEDCYHKIKFVRMEEIQITSYKEIK